MSFTNLKYILNLGLGGLSSHAYSYSLGILVVFTPIRSSSFLISECRHVPLTTTSDYCRFMNYVGLLFYDLLHYLFAAIVLTAFVGSIHEFLCRKGLRYNFSSFSVGFLVVATTILIQVFGWDTSHYHWYMFPTWFLGLSVFLVVYHLAMKYLLKV